MRKDLAPDAKRMVAKCLRSEQSRNLLVPETQITTDQGGSVRRSGSVENTPKTRISITDHPRQIEIQKNSNFFIINLEMSGMLKNGAVYCKSVLPAMFYIAQIQFFARSFMRRKSNKQEMTPKRYISALANAEQLINKPSPFLKGGDVYLFLYSRKEDSIMTNTSQTFNKCLNVTENGNVYLVQFNPTSCSCGDKACAHLIAARMSCNLPVHLPIEFSMLKNSLNLALQNKLEEVALEWIDRAKYSPDHK
uniref:SWIM-type domain-containing protein n=1 Tax=Romanomermis culicivorax TaxID=13658 RepID=A0A915ITP8_ROMCU